MKKTLAAILFLAAPLVAQAPVQWQENLDGALKQAKSENKAVFLDIWAEWCPPCQKLKKEVFPSPQAQAALRKVVAASVMVEKKDRTPLPDGEAVARRFNLEVYPTLLVLDADGKELRRHEGYMNPAEFAKFVEGK